MYREKFPFLKKAAYKIQYHFGWAYSSESLFSNMNWIRSGYRSRLTNEHLHDCLLTGLPSHNPSYEALTNDTQCQRLYWHVFITFCKYISLSIYNLNYSFIIWKKNYHTLLNYEYTRINYRNENLWKDFVDYKSWCPSPCRYFTMCSRAQKRYGTSALRRS